MFFDAETLNYVATDKVRSELKNKIRTEGNHQIWTGSTRGGYPATHVYLPGDTKAKKVCAHHLSFQLQGLYPHDKGSWKCICNGGNISGSARISDQHRCMNPEHWKFVPDNAGDDAETTAPEAPAVEAPAPAVETKAVEAPAPAPAPEKQAKKSKKVKKSEAKSDDTESVFDRNGNPYLKKDSKTHVTVADIRFIKSDEASEMRIRDIARKLNVTDVFVTDVFQGRILDEIS